MECYKELVFAIPIFHLGPWKIEYNVLQLTVEVRYSKDIEKEVRRHQLPKEIWVDFRDAFEAFAASRNMRLFDIKRLATKGPYVYFRLRIRNYRAIFHMDDEFIYVEVIGPRGEIYKRWQ